VIVRPERASDVEAIAQVTVAAFEAPQYSSHGFRHYPGLVYEYAPEGVFLALPFGAVAAEGTVAFHGAFLATG
jgi:predicted N-acetyltransferase YhbS